MTGPAALCCPSCSSSNVADLGGYAECRECGYGFAMTVDDGDEHDDELGVAA